MKIALLALVGLGAATLGGVATAQAQTPAAELKTAEQKTAYAIGMDVAHQLKPLTAEYDAKLIVQGLRDGLDGKAALTDAQFLEVLQAFNQKLAAQQREMMAKQQGADGGALAEKNLKAGQEFLAANKTKPGITTLPSGVQYKVLKAGAGASPKATDVVRVNYRGTFIDGNEFDASAKYSPNGATFRANEVITGWTEILQKMKVGDKFQVFIPSDSAYRARGSRSIGPNLTLIFDIELLEINPPDAR